MCRSPSISILHPKLLSVLARFQIQGVLSPMPGVIPLTILPASHIYFPESRLVHRPPGGCDPFGHVQIIFLPAVPLLQLHMPRVQSLHLPLSRCCCLVECMPLAMSRMIPPAQWVDEHVVGSDTYEGRVLLAPVVLGWMLTPLL